MPEKYYFLSIYLIFEFVDQIQNMKLFCYSLYKNSIMSCCRNRKINFGFVSFIFYNLPFLDNYECVYWFSWRANYFFTCCIEIDWLFIIRFFFYHWLSFWDVTADFDFYKLNSTFFYKYIILENCKWRNYNAIYIFNCTFFLTSITITIMLLLKKLILHQ